MANEIYSKSWWGSGVCFNTVGWGLVYKPYAGCGAVPVLLLALETRATYYENETCTIATLDEIEAIAYTAPPAPLYTDDLVASYSFDTDFTDYTGNNNLSISGNVVAGVTGGVVDDCAEFDGVSDYTVAADSDDFSFTDGTNDLPFSASFWANFVQLGGDGAWILSKRTVSINGEWAIFFYQNTFRVDLYSSNQNYISAKFSYTPTTGGTNWSNYAVTYDGSETFGGFTMYLNGVSQTLTNGTVGTYVGMPNSIEPFNIGSRSWEPNISEFDGKMDEVHIWKNRELTSAEVLDVYTTELAGTSILPAIPAPTGLLADYTGASVAYSLRNLISTTTNVVRVRRSNDNTEQDFTAAEITDGTLTTFTGANDGFVSTWYDQAGSLNALQTITANQPKLVSSGVVILRNGKPAVLFDGVNDSMETGYGSEQPLTITFVGGLTNTKVATTTFYGGGGANTSRVMLYTNGGLFNLFAGAVVNSSVSDDTNQHLFFNLHNTTSSSISIDGSVVGTGNNGTQILENFQLGSQLSGSVVFDGYIQEVILYPSDNSSNQVGIETNINTEYTIY